MDSDQRRRRVNSLLEQDRQIGDQLNNIDLKADGARGGMLLRLRRAVRAELEQLYVERTAK
jgi:hypothetical protein